VYLFSFSIFKVNSGSMNMFLIKTSGRLFKKARLCLVFIIMTLFICGFFSCLNNNSINTNDFLIKVDSVKVPETVISGTPFNIQFFGTIGFDDCTSFKTFNQAILEKDINIEAWGTFEYKNRTCNPALVTLDGYTISMTLYNPGVYRLLITEPGNYTLVKELNVN
jgi:hypothetical protein